MSDTKTQTHPQQIDRAMASKPVCPVCKGSGYDGQQRIGAIVKRQRCSVCAPKCDECHRPITVQSSVMHGGEWVHAACAIMKAARERRGNAIDGAIQRHELDADQILDEQYAARDGQL